MVNLMSAMNASFPEQDFSKLTPDTFAVASVERVRCCRLLLCLRESGWLCARVRGGARVCVLDCTVNLVLSRFGQFCG